MRIPVLVTSTLLAFAIASPTALPAKKKATLYDAADIGYATQNGGTTGGAGGNVTTVSTLAQLIAAVGEKNTLPGIVLVNGTIVGNEKVKVGSNKSIIGLPGASLRGIGLHFKGKKNLIIRNIKSSFVVASVAEDALKIEAGTNVWVDHCEFFSALVADKDYYDGLVDSSHGADFITISHTYFHDHWKTSLVGHSDSNAAQDKGKLHVTYANNFWENVNSRAPLIRFGTGHIYNSYFKNVGSAINTRMGAQVLVQSNAFKNVTTALTSRDSKEVGYAFAEDNYFGSAQNNAPQGDLFASSIPYKYSLMGSGAVPGTVPLQAGAILSFAKPEPSSMKSSATRSSTQFSTQSPTKSTIFATTLSTTLSTTSSSTASRTASIISSITSSATPSVASSTTLSTASLSSSSPPSSGISSTVAPSSATLSPSFSAIPSTTFSTALSTVFSTTITAVETTTQLSAESTLESTTSESIAESTLETIVEPITSEPALPSTVTEVSQIPAPTAVST